MLCFLLEHQMHAQASVSPLNYTVSTPHPQSHYYHVELQTSGWTQDTLEFKMPQWTPGYYQMMNYANAVENFSVEDDHNQSLTSRKLNGNTWEVTGIKNKSFNLS